MQSGGAMGGEPDAEPIQLHAAVVAFLDMPHPATLAKTPGRRCLKIARTAPVTATSAHRKTLQVIRNLFSHVRILLCLAVLFPPRAQFSSSVQWTSSCNICRCDRP